MGKPAPES